jgi:cellulose 1,4-beta-cellobiosidase
LRFERNICLLCFYPDFDEQRYVNALAPLLTAQGFPAHFIIDQGRSGVQPTSQLQQGDWCNVINTGFGTRPTTNTGDALVDAIVWVKPGGESDGTSDSTSARYDAHCGYADALKPAPEAGTWFQAYFEQLLKNANPAL